MFLKLRILFTILSAVCLAVVIPAGALFGNVWFFIFGGGAGIFFLAMLLCKQKQEELEPTPKEEPPIQEEPSTSLENENTDESAKK